jgi:hypothetical protein
MFKALRAIFARSRLMAWLASLGFMGVCVAGINNSGGTGHVFFFYM